MSTIAPPLNVAGHMQEFEEKWLRTSLQEQYQCVEEYCNAQTRLNNALVNNRSRSQHKWERVLYEHTLQKATQGLSESIQTVRSCMIKIESQIPKGLFPLSDSDGNRNTRQAWQQHLERSRRVLQTLFQSGGGQFYASGIPVGKYDSESKMIGLATLRASRARFLSCLDK